MQMLLLGFRNKNTPQYPFVSMLHDNLKNNIESVANDIKYIVNNNNNNVYQFTQIIKNKKMALESNDRLYLSDDLFDWNRVFKNHFHEYNIITTNTNYATEPPLKLYNDAIHRLINIHNHKHTGMNTVKAVTTESRCSRSLRPTREFVGVSPGSLWHGFSRGADPGAEEEDRGAG